MCHAHAHVLFYPQKDMMMSGPVEHAYGVSHSKGVHSKVSLCEPPLLWSTFCGRWCLTPYTSSIGV